MELGWIDFSKEDRAKALSVMELLSEDDTLDELGIAPVRDGFANLFFPGTSTIQTRAKYLLIVPYALADLENRGIKDPRTFLTELDAIENDCAKRLVATNAERIIGSRSIAGGRWVKRTPANIYWAGLRRYGIFKGDRLSLAEYARVCCALQGRKQTLRSIGGRQDEAAGGGEQDDLDAGSLPGMQFWNLPDYPEDWKDNLCIELTHAEAAFLKAQIIKTYPSSMMAFLLENGRSDIASMEGFEDMATGAVHDLPVAMQDDYWLANQLSWFIYMARIRYNVMLSRRENKMANEVWEECLPLLETFASLDIAAIFLRLGVVNPNLRAFLLDIQRLMLAGDIAGLDDRICKRECDLKGPSRAKLGRCGEFDPQQWVGGGLLDYRFGNACIIMRDIFAGEESV